MSGLVLYNLSKGASAELYVFMWLAVDVMDHVVLLID